MSENITYGGNMVYSLETMEDKILRHLYEMGIHDLNGGWKRISNFDEIAVDSLYRARLIEKSVLSPVFIRLSELGVGTVLFGYLNKDKILELL